ncbi:hypothetical protein FSP39_005023 [Pinctada imbricata]|uniref:G-protein coupled receptors family 1 profile domain-containing protein n=1 Tax=Pinctada imbricata TaxID=66713 RepID=A0AA88Y4Y2_PINIB|nr:hypothetical protein FSP39_005023 [Pinctada imbricata]
MASYSFNVSTSTDTSQSQHTYLTLQERNDSIASQRLPTIIFLGILVALGIIGNVTVLLVYGLRYRPTTFRLYILSLAVIDLLSCCIAIPLEMADNLFPLMFYSEALCKIGRFFGNVFKIGSAFVLIVMAAGRYWKICRPFSTPSTLKSARRCVAFAIGMAVLFSWPNAIIQGLKVRSYPGNVTGYDCSIDDDIVKTEFPFIYSTILFVVYMVTFILLCVLYTKVVLELRRHVKKTSSFKLNDKVKKSNPRITKLMIAITLAFILCYLPNCVLDAGTTFKRDYLFPPSPLVLGLLPLLSRTFFINNIINPVIYFIGEAKFRRILKKYLRSVYYLCV